MTEYPVVLFNHGFIDLSEEVLSRAAELGYDILAHADSLGIDTWHEDWIYEAPIIRHHPALVQAMSELSHLYGYRIEYVTGPYTILSRGNEYIVQRDLLNWIDPSIVG